MKSATAAMIGNCVMWASVAVGVSVALCLTHRLVVLWFFLIPAVTAWAEISADNR